MSVFPFQNAFKKQKNKNKARDVHGRVLLLSSRVFLNKKRKKKKQKKKHSSKRKLYKLIR